MSRGDRTFSLSFNRKERWGGNLCRRVKPATFNLRVWHQLEDKQSQFKMTVTISYRDRGESLKNSNPREWVKETISLTQIRRPMIKELSKWVDLMRMSQFILDFQLSKLKIKTHKVHITLSRSNTTREAHKTWLISTQMKLQVWYRSKTRLIMVITLQSKTWWTSFSMSAEKVDPSKTQP